MLWEIIFETSCNSNEKNINIVGVLILKICSLQAELCNIYNNSYLYMSNNKSGNISSTVSAVLADYIGMPDYIAIAA